MDSYTLAQFLGWLKDRDQIVITVEAAAMREALTMAAGGPEVMSTSQAAEFFGWSSRRWRGWAADGRVAGAWQEENGDWRLPRESCRERVEAEAAAGRRAPKLGPITVQPRAARSRNLSPMPALKSSRRGPRRKVV